MSMGWDKKYKLYVFDLDGTLVDTKLDIARAMQKVLGDAGYPKPGLDEVERAIGGGARNALKKLTGAGDDVMTPMLSSFIAAYEEMCSDNTVVYDGAEELLKNLKAQGAKLAVVTMKVRGATHKILKHHGLFDLFDAILTFDDLEKRKPDPDSLYMLQKRFDVSPSDTLMVGDSMTDLDYAKAGGVDACGVTFGYGVTEDMKASAPRYMISEFSEVI
jgi:phosphoglycolate phosphatase